MSESVSTPRVSSPYLDSYVGRNVMIVGQVSQLRGEIAVLNSDGNVTVNLNRVSTQIDAKSSGQTLTTLQEAHLTNGNGAQVIGKVNPDLTIKALSSTDLGPDVGMFCVVNPTDRPPLTAVFADYSLVKSVVEATQHHRSLFVFDN